MELQETTADESPNEFIGNKLTVSLDLSKAPILALPAEQEITIVAKSRTGTDPVEATENQVENTARQMADNALPCIKHHQFTSEK